MVVTSYKLPKDLVQGLKIKSFELSAQRGTKVTSAQIVEEALLKFGVKPYKAPKQ